MTPEQKEAEGAKVRVEVEGRELTLSNLDKPLYPGGFTKGQVIDYYRQIAPVMLPHLKDRPITLNRFPNGVEAQSFFAKHLPKGTPIWVKRAELPPSPKSKDSKVEYVLIDELAALIWTANLAALELHIPMWKADAHHAPEPPDLMVFDLDPGPGTTAVQCCEVALILADWLASERGAVGYPKTSGSKGIQLYVPIAVADRAADWGDGTQREDAHEIANALAKAHPDLIVSNMRKDLRDNHVLIDWSQNHVAKTTVAVYSLRARPEPTVSTPITWEEVAACADSGDPTTLQFFTHDVLARVQSHGDLFAPLLN